MCYSHLGEQRILSKPKKGEDEDYTSKKFQKQPYFVVLVLCYNYYVDVLLLSSLHINVQIIWIGLLLAMIFSAAC